MRDCTVRPNFSAISWQGERERERKRRQWERERRSLEKRRQDKYPHCTCCTQDGRLRLYSAARVNTAESFLFTYADHPITRHSRQRWERSFQSRIFILTFQPTSLSLSFWCSLTMRWLPFLIIPHTRPGTNPSFRSIPNVLLSAVNNPTQDDTLVGSRGSLYLVAEEDCSAHMTFPIKFPAARLFRPWWMGLAHTHQQPPPPPRWGFPTSQDSPQDFSQVLLPFARLERLWPIRPDGKKGINNVFLIRFQKKWKEKKKVKKAKYIRRSLSAGARSPIFIWIRGISKWEIEREEEEEEEGGGGTIKRATNRVRVCPSLHFLCYI